MRNKAILMLGIAVLFGIAAAYMVNMSVSRQVASQAQAPAADREMQTVVVAAERLPVGTQLERLHIKEIQMPAEVLPENHFASRDEVLALESSTVLTEMQAGEFVLPVKLSGGVTRRGVTTKIPDGYRAASIPVDEIRGVGGFVLPGDKVDVLHTTSVGRRDEQPVTRTLFQNLTVLSVNQVSSETSEDPIVGKVVTLLVRPDQAKQMTLAQQVGNLSLALRNEGDSGLDGTATVALTDLWEYSPGEVRVSSQPTTQPAASPPPRPPKRSIQIIRGLEIHKENVEGSSEAGEEADEGARQQLVSTQ